MRNLSVDVPLRLGIMTNYGEQNEFCTMMLDFLAWPYELIVGDEMGMVNTKDPATDIVTHNNASDHKMRIDLTEELLNGKIDMICVPTIMSATRLAAHDFVYPTSAAGREVRIVFFLERFGNFIAKKPKSPLMVLIFETCAYLTERD